ncbi:MAG: putative rane protein [Verrucomicrobiota bacterium]|jgi:putative membrane protein
MKKAHAVLLLGVVAVFAWSAWQPYDWLTWWLEIFPGLAGLIVLAATYRKFQFTTLCYTLIALHISLLCVGGHYTYAREPLFNWLREIFHWHRNHYDRLGHFAQGFVPAMIARELFIRLKILNRPRWMAFLILSICLAISAFYELIEWWTALLSGSASTAFLATQGDVWDTQADMLMALIGAISALILLRPWQDRQLAAAGREPKRA